MYLKLYRVRGPMTSAMAGAARPVAGPRHRPASQPGRWLAQETARRTPLRLRFGEPPRGRVSRPSDGILQSLYGEGLHHLLRHGEGFHDLQMESFRAFTAKAFTTFFALDAFTLTIFPNIIFLEAGLAGLTFNFSITTPGMVNFPVLPTSFSARLDSAPKTRFTTFGFNSDSCPMLANIALEFMAFTAFMAFIALAMLQRLDGRGRALLRRRERL